MRSSIPVVVENENRSDSNHDIRHRMAAFHSIANFMENLPMTEDKVQKETKSTGNRPAQRV